MCHFSRRQPGLRGGLKFMKINSIFMNFSVKFIVTSELSRKHASPLSPLTLLISDWEALSRSRREWTHPHPRWVVSIKIYKNPRIFIIIELIFIKIENPLSDFYKNHYTASWRPGGHLDIYKDQRQALAAGCLPRAQAVPVCFGYCWIWCYYHRCLSGDSAPLCTVAVVLIKL